MGPPGAVMAVVALLAPAEAVEAVTVAGALVGTEGLSDLLTGGAGHSLLEAWAPAAATCCHRSRAYISKRLAVTHHAARKPEHSCRFQD